MFSLTVPWIKLVPRKTNTKITQRIVGYIYIVAKSGTNISLERKKLMKKKM